MYIHVCNNNKLFKSELSTSTAIKKGLYQDYLYFPYGSSYYNFKEPVRLLINALYHYKINEYNHAYNYCCVFPSNFEDIFKTLRNILYEIKNYGKYKDMRKAYKDLLNLLKSFQGNLFNQGKIEYEIVYKELVKFKELIENKKANIDQKKNKASISLLKRFSKNTRKNQKIIEKYFQELLNLRKGFESYGSIFERDEDILSFLRKFYGGLYPHRYESFLMNHGFILIVPHDIIPLALNYIDINDLVNNLYVDSCVENNMYVICKLVYLIADNLGIKGVGWVGLIGYDKLTNQRFIHYVPNSLFLHHAETCRKWVLGLVNNFGREREDYNLIET